MNAQDAIRQTANTSMMVLQAYVSDLDDGELMHRPSSACNHLAWQLGHLIASECQLLNSICPGTAAELPAGFAEQHSKEQASNDDPSAFYSKQEYVDLLAHVRGASLAALAKVSAEDLDKPGPDHFKDMFPTVGSVFVLIATHALMHAGQFVPVRRALGKPVVI